MKKKGHTPSIIASPKPPDIIGGGEGEVRLKLPTLDRREAKLLVNLRKPRTFSPQKFIKQKKFSKSKLPFVPKKNERKSYLVTQKRLSPLFIVPLFILLSFLKLGKFCRQIIQSFLIIIYQKISSLKKPSTPIFPNSRKLSYLLSPFKKRVKFKIVTTVLIIVAIGYSSILIGTVSKLPSPDRLVNTTRPLTTQVYDRKGQLLYQFYEGQNRKLVSLDELPQHVVEATIAIEDKHFYSHPGVDLEGVIRAVRNNFSEGTLQGGSTITQQLIKNTLLTPDKTFKRKLQEVILAFWTERLYTKKEILQMYFNEVPYGGPAWGIQTASEMYFGKNPKDLNLAESAYLAGLPAAPTEYSPYGIYPQKGKERQREVLRRMVEDKYISAEEATKVYNQQLAIIPPTQNIKAPHFVMYVRSVLAAKYGDRAVSQGGLKVITTLDLNLQEMAEKVVLEEVNKLSKLKVGNGAAMITNPNTGQILAMVGSKDYFDTNGGNFNVTLATRQPGSSVKPITYAVAFEQGFSPGSILLDTPVTYKNPWGASYSPVNYDGRFHGPVSIRVALGSSYNVPAVKMLATVGIPNLISKAQQMGITTLNEPEKYGLSLTLGGGAVKMVDMMSVYGTIASGGLRYQPTPILKVTDSFGNILEDNTQPNGQKVLTEEVAYLLTHILSDKQARTPAFGSNSLLEIPGYTVAVKTGTSDDKRDNWAFGFTPKYVVGAWVGNNNNSPMDPRLTSGITGATPIWHEITKRLSLGEPNLAFKRPKGIVEVSLGGRKDLAISGKTAKSLTQVRKKKEKDESTGQEKEVLTFSDPFGIYTPN